MKAALLDGIKKLSVREVETPKVRPGTVLLRVGACGICGSDLKFYNHGDRVKIFPHILGHEIAGEIVEVGKNVSSLKEGDRIALGNEIPCTKCYACKRGLDSVCENALSIGTMLPGGLSEYMLLTEEMVERGPINMMPKNLSFDEGALAEPLGCVVNGLEFARMQAGKSVLIVGTGPIGCLMIELSKLLGASKIVVVDKFKDRLDMARHFNADEYVLPETDNFTKDVLDITETGYDVVMSANSSSRAHEQAILCAAKGGFVNLFGGVAKGLPDAVSFPNNFLHYRHVSIGGSFSQTRLHHKKALEYLATGRINTRKIITHKFRLDDIQKAFDNVQNASGLKTMVNP